MTATHPVAMTARFRELLVVTYAFPPAVLEPLVPASLALEQHDGHGFLAVALVDLDGLRPAALPRRLGWPPASPATGSSCAPPPPGAGPGGA